MKAAHFLRGGWDFTVAEDSTTNERFPRLVRSPAEGRGIQAPDHSPIAIGPSVAVAVEALAIASEAQADWASELEAGAAHAAAAVRDEVYAAANRAAAAAQSPVWHERPLWRWRSTMSPTRSPGGGRDPEPSRCGCDRGRALRHQCGFGDQSGHPAGR
jgi:hypothetical protein